jgi:hypothetical protein
MGCSSMSHTLTILRIMFLDALSDISHKSSTRVGVGSTLLVRGKDLLMLRLD